MSDAYGQRFGERMRVDSAPAIVTVVAEVAAAAVVVVVTEVAVGRDRFGDIHAPHGHRHSGACTGQGAHSLSTDARRAASDDRISPLWCLIFQLRLCVKPA